jgi:hypothetical protein
MEFLKHFKVLFKNPEKRDEYLKKVVEFYLKNNLFDVGEIKRQLRKIQGQVNSIIYRKGIF